MWEGRSRRTRPSGEYISPLSLGSSQEVLAMIILLTLENTRTILCCWKAVARKKQQKRKCFSSLLFLKGCLLSLGIRLGFYWPELRFTVIKLFPQRLFQHHFLCGNWGQNFSILKWKYKKITQTLSALGKALFVPPGNKRHRPLCLYTHLRAMPHGLVWRKPGQGALGIRVNSVTWNSIMMTGDAEHFSNSWSSDSIYASFSVFPLFDSKP